MHKFCLEIPFLDMWPLLKRSWISDSRSTYHFPKLPFYHVILDFSWMIWLQNCVLNIFYFLIDFLWFHSKVKHFCSFASSFFNDNLKIYPNVYCNWQIQIFGVWCSSWLKVWIPWACWNFKSRLTYNYFKQCKWTLQNVILTTILRSSAGSFIFSEFEIQLQRSWILNRMFLRWLKFCDFNLWDFFHQITTRVAKINDKIAVLVKWFVIFDHVVTSYM